MPRITVRTLGPVAAEDCRRLVERLSARIQEAFEQQREPARVLVEELGPGRWRLGRLGPAGPPAAQSEG